MNDLERRRAADARHHENRARLAMAYARFDSEGSGSMEFEDGVDFGLTFIEQPYVTTGHVIDLDELAEALGLDEGVTPPIPQVSSYVTEWQIDDRGFYVGAWCAAVVSDMALPEGVTVSIQHHFTFSAVAIKDVPIDVTT